MSVGYLCLTPTLHCVTLKESPRPHPGKNMPVPDTCVVVHDIACLSTGVSESKIIETTVTVLEDIYPSVLRNPDSPPDSSFDLWVVFPPHEETWEDQFLDSPNLRRSVSVEQTPRIPDFDVYMNTEHHKYGSDLVDQIPFIPWVPHVPTVSKPPRDYVFWNGCHNDMRQDGEWQEVPSVLKRLGIRRVMMAKVWGGGEYPPICDDPWFEVTALERNLPDREYNRLLAESFALFHTGTRINSYQQDMALSYGIPIYGDRVAHINWSAHFTTLAGLSRYVGNEGLYQQRKVSYYGTFGFQAAKSRLLGAVVC